jgi:hypothetical protein
LRNITIDELVIDEDIYNDHKDKWLFVDKNYKLNTSITVLKVKPEWGKTMLWEEFMRWNL